jgi:hypothetical protein
LTNDKEGDNPLYMNENKWGPPVWDEKRGMFLQKLLGEYNPSPTTKPILIEKIEGPQFFVYFIQAENSDGFIKIGFAKNPIKRLLLFQTGNPYKLKLLGVISGVTEHYELELHVRFQRFRVRGEWFRPDSELLDFIQQEVLCI